MTLKLTESLRGFFKALTEPPTLRDDAPQDPNHRNDNGGDNRQSKPDESFFWGWSMYGHW